MSPQIDLTLQVDIQASEMPRNLLLQRESDLLVIGSAIFKLFGDALEATQDGVVLISEAFDFGYFDVELLLRHRECLEELMDALVALHVEHLMLHDVLLVENFAPKRSCHTRVLHERLHLLHEQAHSTIQVGIDEALQLLQLQLELEFLEAINHLLELVLEGLTRFVLLQEQVQLVGSLESHPTVRMHHELIQLGEGDAVLLSEGHSIGIQGDLFGLFDGDHPRK